jgi:TctA family transporter
MDGALSQAISEVVFTPKVWLVICGSAVYGLFIGAVPGLTATMAVALIVPLTYFMTPIEAMAAVVTLVACAIFAGDIPGALLRIPGTPASAAYAEDAYALTRRGEGHWALGVGLLFSVAGGLFGVLMLILFAQPLAALATHFSVAEYFWFYLLGLSCAVVVSRGSVLRSGFALIIGLLLSTVGLSAVHTQARFTFNEPELFQGINFIPAMIGLFGLSEILKNVTSGSAAIEPVRTEQIAAAWRWHGGILTGVVPLLWQRKWHALRSGGIGALIGMLPGAGADIAAWVSMAASKRWSRKPDEYGRGSIEGIGDATAANSSALAGAWVPALVFGIPGDSITAIVIGVLLMKNVQPGPEIFQKQAVLVYSIYIVFLLANLILVPVGLIAIRLGRALIRVPRQVLLPVILLFCVLGAYAINGSYFDVGLMAVMGVLGFALERGRIPLGPVVLGIVLGGPLEERFVQTLTSSGGSLAAFVSRPVAAGLAAICLLLWVAPLWTAWRGRVRAKSLL